MPSARAEAERQITLLAALAVYDTWHSVMFLARRALIPPDWPEATTRAVAAALSQAGEVQTRRSDTKGLMYKITDAGKTRLMFDTTRKAS